MVLPYNSLTPLLALLLSQDNITITTYEDNFHFIQFNEQKVFKGRNITTYLVDEAAVYGTPLHNCTHLNCVIIITACGTTLRN